MIFIRQDEIEELTQILSDVGIVPLTFVKKFLKKRRRTDEQIDIIINQMVKRKLAYYDDNLQFLRVNKSLSSNDVHVGMSKCLWVLLDLLQNVGEYFIIHNSPKKITFVNKNIDPAKKDPFFDIYFIPFGAEKIDSFTINNLNKTNEPIKCFVVIEDPSQIPKIALNENFNIYNFVTVDKDGNPSYISLKKSKKEDK